MTEVSTDVKKIAGAAAKIENAQRRGAIQPKVLGAFNIDPEPISRVFVTVDPSSVWPIRTAFAQFGKLRLIKRRQDSPCIYRMTPAADVLPKALKQFKGKKLLDLARKSHLERMQLTAAQTSNE